MSLALLESAWGIIANAGGGDWGNESPEWKKAAERWRDEYHQELDSDTQPISGEWLRSVGYLDDRHLYRVCRGLYSEYWPERGLVVGDDAEDDGGGHALKTRGDVRRLCAALGIELKG